MYIYVFDEETTLHSSRGFAADPHDDANWIVWHGSIGVFLDQDALVAHWESDAEWNARTYAAKLMAESAAEPQLARFREADEVDVPPPYTSHDRCVLVAHNAKFDLTYLLRQAAADNAQCWAGLLQSPKGADCAYEVWDTQQAEYRILRQRVAQPALDFCCERRGWPVKPGRLKEYWEKGISTETIPDEEVRPYLAHDVTSTLALYLDQQRYLWKKHKLREQIKLDCQMVREITLMEHSGIAYNTAAAARSEDEMRRLEQNLVLSCAQYLPQLVQLSMGCKPPDGIPWNPASNSLVSAVLYGGRYKVKLPKPALDDQGRQVVYKTGKKKGQLKTRLEEENLEFLGVLPEMEEALRGKVDADSLAKLRYECMSRKADKYKLIYEFLGYLLKLRKCSKEISTYLKGYTAAVWPDGRIRTDLTMSVTRTTRLSSRKPNMQNPSALAKECFESQYDGGAILDADYSQIEVVVAAQMSQSRRMIEDIKRGVDFHCKRVAAIRGLTYEHVYAQVNEVESDEWIARRKSAKRVSFQAQYGAVAHNIAVSLGIPIEEVQALLDADARAYPEVDALWSRLALIAEGNCHKDVGQDNIAWGTIVSPFGEEYSLPCRKRGNRWTVYRPKLMNYPIQGHAATIIKLAIVALARRIRTWTAENLPAGEADVPRIVLTVHDSIIVDLPGWLVRDANTLLDFAAMVSRVMRLTPPHVLKERFGVEYKVPLSCDVKIGKTWSPNTMMKVKSWIDSEAWKEAGPDTDESRNSQTETVR